MPRWEPIHPELLVALRVLDAIGLPYAEMWRTLRPIAARLDCPRPSYWKVRRVLIEERRRKLERAAVASELVGDMITGKLPYRYR
jgi:hypothetical protein